MKFTFKIWLLIVCVLLSLIAIFGLPPTALQNGALVSSVDSDSPLFAQGLRTGMVITEVNGVAIDSAKDYEEYMQDFVGNDEEVKLIVMTKDLEIIGLYNSSIYDDVAVEDISSTKLKTGLDLRGGIRVLVGVENGTLDSESLDELISVSEERLNVYGLSDMNFFKVSKSDGNMLMGIEIAGSTPENIESLVASQGKFEAKIGNETVFVGGNKDITHIGKTGTDAMVTDCGTASDGQEYCTFQFAISLSAEAAQRHADITSKLKVNQSSKGAYLEKQIDFYVDDVVTSSLNIGADLKGNAATQIAISGTEFGATREDAINAAKSEMKRLQAILSTGSLPYKMKIEKVDRVSPTLGEEFTKEILLGGLLAVLAVSAVIFVRYRKIKVSLALIFVSMSEVIIILGVAALIGWNLNLPSIAGIIATIGTGIDSQIVIMDEARVKSESMKTQIKKALFVIVTAFATTFVALLPLTGILGFMGIDAAGAGLLKGFAVTTMIGLVVGITLSRPAFADIAKQLEE